MFALSVQGTAMQVLSSCAHASGTEAALPSAGSGYWSSIVSTISSDDASHLPLFMSFTTGTEPFSLTWKILWQDAQGSWTPVASRCTSHASRRHMHTELPKCAITSKHLDRPHQSGLSCRSMKFWV